MKNELEQIAAERARQITAEGWTPEHDDKHGNGELAEAARSYEWHSDTTVNTGRVCMHMIPPSWPWGPGWWKPTTSPHRGYVKAGALYQAEADRCRRLGNEAGAIAMDEKVHTVAAKLAALPPEPPPPYVFRDVSGRPYLVYRGWLHYRHPDNQWVTLRELKVGDHELWQSLRISDEEAAQYGSPFVPKT